MVQKAKIDAEQRNGLQIAHEVWEILAAEWASYEPKDVNALNDESYSAFFAVVDEPTADRVASNFHWAAAPFPGGDLEEYIRYYSQKPGVHIITPEGKFLDTRLVEYVDPLMCEQVVGRGAGMAAAGFGSLFGGVWIKAGTNGVALFGSGKVLVSSSQVDIRHLAEPKYERTQAAEPGITIDELAARLQANYQGTEVLRYVQGFPEVDFSKYPLADRDLVDPVIAAAKTLAQDQEAHGLLLAGPLDLMDMVTVPLNGNYWHDHYSVVPEVGSEEFAMALKEVCVYDGAQYFSPIGRDIGPVGSRLFVRRVSSNGLERQVLARIDDARKLAAASMSDLSKGTIAAVVVDKGQYWVFASGNIEEYGNMH
ncbi:MAG: hypothetical protein ABIG95_03060 [Candidatus Woesearchaeota archaeon]